MWREAEAQPAGQHRARRKSHPRATMLPARTVLLLTLLLAFSLHHATGKEPQGPLLQVRALSPHRGIPLGRKCYWGVGMVLLTAGATLWAGQGRAAHPSTQGWMEMLGGLSKARAGERLQELGGGSGSCSPCLRGWREGQQAAVWSLPSCAPALESPRTSSPD